MGFFFIDFGEEIDGVGVSLFKDFVFLNALITFMVLGWGEDRVVFLNSVFFDP